MSSIVVNGLQCPAANKLGRGLVSQRTNMLSRAQQAQNVHHLSGLRSPLLNPPSITSYQSSVNTSCTATADAPASTAAPSSVFTPTSVSTAEPKKKVRGTAAGTQPPRLMKQIMKVRPELPPLADKLLTCAITRSETWEQLADVYARSRTNMNAIHISTMLVAVAGALKESSTGSVSGKETFRQADTDPESSESSDSDSVKAVHASSGTAASFIHIPYNNAPASVQALLAALESDALKVLPAVSPRSLATTLYGITKAWAQSEKMFKASSSKELGIWRGPSAEFLELFGARATRTAAEFNAQDLSSILHSLGNLRKASYAPMSKALGPTNPTGVALRTAMLLAVNQVLPSVKQPQVISMLALGLANLRYSPGTPLLLELQSASMRVMVPQAGEHPEMIAISNVLWGLSSLVGPQRKVQPASASESDGQEDGSSVKKKPQPIVSSAFLQAMTVAALSWRRPKREVVAVTQKEVSLAAKAVKKEARHAAYVLRLAAQQAEEGVQHPDSIDGTADASIRDGSSRSPESEAPALTQEDSTVQAASAVSPEPTEEANLQPEESESVTSDAEVNVAETASAEAVAIPRLTLTHATPQLAQNLFWALSRLNYTPTGQMPQMLQDWSRQALPTADPEALSLLIGSLAAFQVQENLDPEWLSDFSESAAGKMVRARPECVVRVLGALSRMRVSHVDRRLSNTLWRHVRTHVGSMYKAEDIMFLILAAEGARRNEVDGAEEGMEVDEELEESGMAAALKTGSEGVPGSVRIWAPSAGIPWIAIAAAWDAGKFSESVSEILGQRVEMVLSRVRDL